MNVNKNWQSIIAYEVRKHLIKFKFVNIRSPLYISRQLQVVIVQSLPVDAIKCKSDVTILSTNGESLTIEPLGFCKSKSETPRSAIRGHKI